MVFTFDNEYFNMSISHRHTHLEQDEDEEQLVDDSDTKPESPVSYRERKCVWELKQQVTVCHFQIFKIVGWHLGINIVVKGDRSKIMYML